MGFLDRTKSQHGRERKAKEREAAKETEHKEPEKKTRKRAASHKRKSVFPDQERPTSSSSRKSFHLTQSAAKSEDLMNMPVVEQFIDIKSGKDTFSFPTPSPRLPPPRKSMTFQASPSPLASNQPSPQIGVALGSPTHAPKWGRAYTADQISSRMPRQPTQLQTSATVSDMSEMRTARPQLKKSKSSWRTFGGLFKSKPARSMTPEPVQGHFLPQYDGGLSTPVIQRELVLPSPSVTPAPVTSPDSISSHHSRTPSIKRGRARLEARAEVDKAVFMANIDGKTQRSPPGAVPRKNIVNAAPPAKNFRASEDIFKAMDYERLESAARIPGAIPRMPRLEVDIPNLELDRYSVMFEKFLQRQPSLLERRQSKNKGLTSAIRKDDSLQIAPPKISDQQLKSALPQRSATSPHLGRIPSLYVPEEETEQDQPSPNVLQPVLVYHRPRLLQRSRTAPPNSISPVRAAFARQMHISSPGSPASPLYSENSLPPTPTTITTYNDTDETVAVISNDPLPYVRRETDESEPSWEMVTSKAVKVSPLATVYDDGGQDHGRHLRVRSPEDLERQVVQVSIARQVSVSRARRHVEHAVTTKQPLRPKVVELSRNRKSTLVLIESDD